MLHRKIVQPVLSNLEGERADYFHTLLRKLEEDPRVEPVANLVYLTLKVAIPYLPTYLETEELKSILLAFVTDNQSRLNRALFDRSYVEESGNLEAVREITNAFVSDVLSAVLEKYDNGHVAETTRTAYRFSGDFENEDFPYQDLDD